MGLAQKLDKGLPRTRQQTRPGDTKRSGWAPGLFICGTTRISIKRLARHGVVPSGRMVSHRVRSCENTLSVLAFCFRASDLDFGDWHVTNPMLAETEHLAPKHKVGSSTCK